MTDNLKAWGVIGLLVIGFIAFTSTKNTNTSNTSNTNNPAWISIKYRDTPININNGYFNCIDTSKSSLVTLACYDGSNQYLIIGLQGRNYHYCNFTLNSWSSFANAKSFGNYYNNNIKGRFSCINKRTPNY